jgi:urease beta subunit
MSPSGGEFGRQAKNAGAYPFTCTLKNSGDRPLRIESARSGCSCLTFTLPKRELAPGETVEMKGVLATAAYEGHVEKGIFLLTNDDQARTRTIRLHVFVPYGQAGLRVQGKTGRITAQTVGGKVRLKASPVLENCNPSGVITVTAVKLPDGWKCRTPLPLRIPAETAVRLELVAEAGDGASFGTRAITILTDSKEKPELPGTLLYAKPDALRPPLPKGAAPPDEDCGC